MEVVLVHPEIPHNTGCAARLAAATGLALHLVEPLGFSLDDRHLKRAGLDYWPLVELALHRDWRALASALSAGGEEGSGGSAGTPPRGPLAERLRLFTARGGTSLFETPFEQDDVLVFGCESRGLPPDLLAAHPSRRVYIPIRAGVRSLNLANSLALGVYTAMVRAGVPLPSNDGRYEPHPRAAEDVRPRERARPGHALPGP